MAVIYYVYYKDNLEAGPFTSKSEAKHHIDFDIQHVLSRSKLEDYEIKEVS